ESLLDVGDDRIADYPGFEEWWRTATTTWELHRSSDRLSLSEQVDYCSKPMPRRIGKSPLPPDPADYRNQPEPTVTAIDGSGGGSSAEPRVAGVTGAEPSATWRNRTGLFPHRLGLRRIGYEGLQMV